METQRLLIVLTGVNLGLLGYQLVQPHSGEAATVDAPAVIRGRALEIVDDRGLVRASLSGLPADPKIIWNGKPYPETVLLPLMRPEGRPNVTLGSSKRAPWVV